MLSSFSYNENQIDSSLYYQVWNEIRKLGRYFSKFCWSDADEAMQDTLMHCLTHYREGKGDLVPYIKKLARTISRNNNKKMVLVDFLEQTLEDSSEEESKPKVDVGRFSDFSSTVVNQIMISSYKEKEVIKLALTFIDKFLLLCDSLKNHDTSVNYYPDVFVKECLKLSRGCDNFNQICISVFDRYGDMMTQFLGYDINTKGTWVETDFTLLSSHASKRVTFVNPDTGVVVEDPDVDRCVLKGNIGSKRVLRVDYYDLWELMCDYVDSPDLNALRLTIGDSFVVRTLGGSMSVVNPDLFNIYDLCRSEILTNVLKETYSRVIGVGSQCFYLLAPQSEEPYKIEERIIRGIHINLKVDDITEEVECL